MEETDEPRPRRRFAWLILTVLLVVFVLYPLSIGPAFVLRQINPRLSKAFRGVYFPVIGISKMTQTESVLADYVHWWILITKTEHRDDNR